MLTLTRKSDYALLALSHLAQMDDKVSSAREIAGEYAVSSALLMNVLKILAKEGLVTSTRGAHGGYKLAREPEQITLKNVIEAIEGPVMLFQCSQGKRSPDSIKGCDRQDICPISIPARKVANRMREFLDGVTLTDIVNGQHGPMNSIQSDSKGESTDAIGISR